jgi:hypothetical protein
MPAGLLSEIKRAAIRGVEICTAAITKLDQATKVLEEGKRHFVHLRNFSHADAKRCLVRLRRKYMKEKPATTAHRAAHLLTMWDPDTKWPASSLRVYVYEKQ